MADPVITDAELYAMRDAGELICQCPHPIPERITWFRTWQCARCGGPILRNTHQQG
jgi:hypothetical protein